MKIYVRYVLFGVIKLFAITLLGLTLGLLLALVFQMSLKTGFPYSYSFRLAPYLIPEIFTIALPVASLFATTVFFSKMSANNEIIALKALGIAPWKVLAPIWCLMIGISVSCIWFNDLSISWTRVQLNRVLLEGVESMLLSQLRSEKKFVVSTGDFEVKVSDVTDDNTLVNPEFSGKLADLNGVAESAKIDVEFNSANPTLNIHLTNAEVEVSGGDFYSPDHYDFSVPLAQIYNSKNRVDPPAKEVKNALENLNAERKSLHRRLASNSIFSFLKGNIDATTKEDWKNRVNSERYYDSQRNRFKIAIPRISAAGFSCFFFVWAGAPFAMLLKKSDIMLAFLYSFLPILIVYFTLFSIGLEGAKSGTLPPIATWMGNVALGVIGLILLKKNH